MYPCSLHWIFLIFKITNCTQTNSCNNCTLILEFNVFLYNVFFFLIVTVLPILCGKMLTPPRCATPGEDCPQIPTLKTALAWQSLHADVNIMGTTTTTRRNARFVKIRKRSEITFLLYEDARVCACRRTCVLVCMYERVYVCLWVGTRGSIGDCYSK